MDAIPAKHCTPRIDMQVCLFAALLVFKEGALTAKALIARFTKDGTLLQEQVCVTENFCEDLLSLWHGHVCYK